MMCCWLNISIRLLHKRNRSTRNKKYASSGPFRCLSPASGGPFENPDTAIAAPRRSSCQQLLQGHRFGIRVELVALLARIEHHPSSGFDVLGTNVESLAGRRIGDGALHFDSPAILRTKLDNQIDFSVGASWEGMLIENILGALPLLLGHRFTAPTGCPGSSFSSCLSSFNRTSLPCFSANCRAIFMPRSPGL